MKCPECKKSVTPEMGEPEVELTEDNVTISASARIFLQCPECSTELRSKSFDETSDMDDGSTEMPDAATVLAEILGAPEGDRLEILRSALRQARDSAPNHCGERSLEETGAEMTERSDGRKKFYGFKAQYTVTCECGDEIATGEIANETDVVVSDMDEES